MVFLSVDSSVYKHGGGTHQWDLSNKDVQYIRRVSLSKSCTPNLFMIRHLKSIPVLQLRGHDLQSSGVFHKNLDYVTYSSCLLLSATRCRLLAYSVTHRDQWNFLHHILFYSNLPVFSTQQDLEPWGSGALSGCWRPLYCLIFFQYALGHSDAECTHLYHLETTDVNTT